jgi:pimeloyl-ACP methyl ester carboxylesterase
MFESQSVSNVEEARMDAPEWFRTALATPARTGRVDAGGTGIATRSWDGPGDRGVLLVHGGAAHARWWDHVAPLLAEDRPVVAMDLSGHGDSDRRDRYDVDRWAAEVLAVRAAHDLPYVVGHSMGGLITLRAAATAPEPLAGVVAIDTPVRPLTTEEDSLRGRTHRSYPDGPGLASRFRPVPAQRAEPWALDHIARHSVHEVADGWQWKWDARIFDHHSPTLDMLHELPGPGAFVFVEHGLVDDGMRAEVLDRLGPRVAAVDLPRAGHHAMLDEPVALTALLRELLAGFDGAQRP